LLFKELKLKRLKLNFRKKSTPLQIKKKRENQGEEKKKRKKIKTRSSFKAQTTIYFILEGRPMIPKTSKKTANRDRRGLHTPLQVNNSFTR
jgi:hypothetical protein